MSCDFYSEPKNTIFGLPFRLGINLYHMVDASLDILVDIASSFGNELLVCLFGSYPRGLKKIIYIIACQENLFLGLFSTCDCALQNRVVILNFFFFFKWW